jgi:hypothetical protein
MSAIRERRKHKGKGTLKIRIHKLLIVALFAAAIGACDWYIDHRTTSTASVAVGDVVQGFDHCREFFPGELPRVPNLQVKIPRALCYDAFAVLHSGQSKTPIFVVEHPGLCDAFYGTGIRF